MPRSARVSNVLSGHAIHGHKGPGAVVVGRSSGDTWALSLEWDGVQQGHASYTSPQRLGSTELWRVFSSASGLGGIGGHEVGECEADMTVLPGDRETAEEGSSSREGSTEEYGGARSLISILCLSVTNRVSGRGPSRPRRPRGVRDVSEL